MFTPTVDGLDMVPARVIATFNSTILGRTGGFQRE